MVSLQATKGRLKNRNKEKGLVCESKGAREGTPRLK